MRSVAFVALLTIGAAAPSHGQDNLRIRAARRDTISAASTVTAAFVISNPGNDSVAVYTRVELPREWTALTGTTALLVPAKATEVLMLSIAVPARMVAGLYTIRVWVTTTQSPRGVSDSVVIRVPVRRALDVALVDRPGFVVSGRPYSASFIVRNRGNEAATVQLKIRSTLGSATLADSILQLGPDESRVVAARVRTPVGLQAANDDVLEIAARYADDQDGALGSARVMVVPEPSRAIEEFLKLPVRVNLRAASSNGVSPYEVLGHGMLRDGGSTRLDFLVRGPTGPFASFGERDEYRAELTAPAWRARLGDQVFMLSALTGAGQAGFGVGAEASRGPLTAGAYGQEFRRVPEKGTEKGAFVSARPFGDARISVNLVDRVAGANAGRIASGAAAVYRPSYSAEMEVARSRNGAVLGHGRSARASGALPALTFDVGHLFADTGFTGSQRGAEHNYFTAHTPLAQYAALGFNGSMHRSDLSRSTGVPYEERFNTGSVTATLFDRYTVEFSGMERGTTIQSIAQSGRQRAARMRLDHDLPFLTLTVEAEAGRTRSAPAARTTFTDATLAARRAFRKGHAGAYLQRYSGGSLTKGAFGTVTLGGDVSAQLTRRTTLALNGYLTRQQIPRADLYSQIDALASHTLPNGTSITLRARLLGGGSLTPSQQNVAFLEYGVPLRIPVSRLRTPGRVYGRVVDAVTGQGVPGALVRLGPQVAITDRRGQVAFGGVPGGEHRLSMSQETSFANAVFVGDPTLLVDSTRAQPTTFNLAIARSARIDVSVRRFVTARTAVAGAPDSLKESGAVSNATLILAGERDTLYRTTDDDGQISFTDIPPGKWSVAIRGDTPAFTRFDPERVELTLTHGETKALTFRLVPRRREVQIIGEGQELRPTAAAPRGQPASGTTKTVKPDERKHDHQR